MAVLVELELPDATVEQVHAVEARMVARGEATGRPPLDGCMVFVVSPSGGGFRALTVWRTQADFEAAYTGILGPDLAAEGIEPDDATTHGIVAMAMPGAHAS